MSTVTYQSRSTGWHSFNDGTLVPYDGTSGYIPGWGMPTWEDDFEGSSLDPAVWNVRNGYQEAQDMSTMRATNVVVENSCVRLVAKKETFNGRDYTSGYIDTIGKWTRRYGRFEFRARLPIDSNTRGLWPGLWLRDATGTGEIDVIESIGGPNNHPEFYPTNGGFYSSSLYKVTGMKTPIETYPYWSQVFQNINAADGQFHSWAFEWTPTYLSFFCDGIMQKTFTPQEWAAFEPGFPSGVNIRIDLFIGSSWGGWPNDTDTVLPRSMDLDYVRYWEYQP